MTKWYFWVDNGEERDPNDFLKSELTLEDDSSMSIQAMSSWAADELDIDETAVDLIVRKGSSETYHLVSLYRDGWKCCSIDEVSLDEITEASA